MTEPQTQRTGRGTCYVPHMIRNRASCIVVGVALLGAACSSGSSDPSTSEVATTVVGDETTTTAAPESTTTVAETTTTVAPEPLTLRNDAIGPYSYGADPTTVVAGLAERLGAAISDTTTNYVEPTGGGYFFNGDRTMNFLFQFGRETCWSIGLCVSFGGVDAASATFIGWTYEGDPASTLATDTGLTLGSRLSDHPGLPALFTCFAGQGAGGVSLYDGVSWIVGSTVVGSPPNLFAVFTSEGAPFDEISNDSGAGTSVIPPADVVVVKRLTAGEVPNDVSNYCP